MQKPVCHVVHVVYRFATGGLENVVIQLINALPRHEFRHTVIALTEIDTKFAARIERDDVECIGLGKVPGQSFWLYPKVYRLLRRLRPDVVHTCNLAAQELMPMAALAGVPLRVHAEHGWDVREIGGKNKIYQILRKLYKPFVNEFIVVAKPLLDYMRQAIGVAPERLHLIPNGVDIERFRPRRSEDAWPEDFPFRQNDLWVIGMVGRLVTIKNPMLLVEAFLLAVESGVPGVERMRLAMIGDGPLSEPIKARMQAFGLADRLWLPGVRADIPEILRALHCFVLPSLSEATSCTLQEAMASGLDIVATDVGGNADLLENGRCGILVPSEDAKALAEAMLSCFTKNNRSDGKGAAARELIENRYSLAVVIERYREIFLGALPHQR